MLPALNAKILSAQNPPLSPPRRVSNGTAICSTPSPHSKMFWMPIISSSWSCWHWKPPAPASSLMHDHPVSRCKALCGPPKDWVASVHLPRLKTRCGPSCAPLVRKCEKAPEVRSAQGHETSPSPPVTFSPGF